MQHGRWYQAEAQLALLLTAGEQAAMEDWKWHNAARLIFQPAPPFHSLISVQGSSMPEPLSHLADPGWLGASMSFAKYLAVFKETTKPPRGAPPAGKVEEARDDGGKGGRRRGGRDGGKGGAAAAVQQD